MRDNWKMMVCAALLIAPLSGCNSFPGMHLFARAPSKSPPMAAQEGNIAPLTRTARDALGAGRPGEAIETFQRALANGEPIAPAVNGMAVAYARIGRLDLAERFFRQAIAVDPIDQRYQMNLAALMQTPAYAQRDNSALKAAAERSRALALEKAAAQTQRPGQLQRLSRQEVQIVSTQAYPPPFAPRLAKVEPPAVASSRPSAPSQPAPSRKIEAE